MTDKPNSISAKDTTYHLHPYTNLKAHEEQGPLVITRGEGVRVFGEDGKEYIEGLSGLWCASLGFNEPRLVKAAQKQMETLPFYHSFTGKVPDVTAELAEKLVDVTPDGLDRALFCNSGSEANDTAIKLVWYYNNARGKPEKKKIISREKAYHGVTIAAGSMTGLAYAQNGFDLPASERILQTSCPHYYRYGLDGESEEAFATRMASELEELILAEGPETVGAMFAEPIQGAGGVILPPMGYFEKIQAVLKKYDVLLIADEVICGFGRTGKMFGSQTYNIKPDMMTLAKQMSSGYLPISALMVSDGLYQVVKERSNELGVFGHGLTYGGHPVPCAVALEVLKIYEERDIVAQVNAISPYFQDRLATYADHPLVGEVRGTGLIGAIELSADKASKTPFDPSLGMGAGLVKKCENHGLILRAMPGDCVAFCPPLISEQTDLDALFSRFDAALAEM
ncbi:Adenosylmethionine-8-amino-7-oxononanoate aminotransferase [Candidatus Terasakiella magnetica]|uniref:Adenosylmethionine-8-amino-7-oxononanoate aminotransferase n=1 Tax=Candidatus Terasakiella magnetica TaxID=1867952 RepID=A0A1C3RLW2_9PROT|nr:aspartate aminotransferase family protein [Candidatus Terasakiella magnetica]SCA58243.1 Adenosylmethionine-8-amino-7-oxononanoate aminotransferase [Candidatus Terasakiella magnetica]